MIVAVAAPGHDRNQQKQGATALVDNGFRAVFRNGKKLLIAVSAGLFGLEVSERRLNVAVFAFSENGITQFSEASLMGLRLHMRGALHQHAHHTDEFVADIVETDF